MPSNATVTLVGHIGEPKISQAGEHPVARFGLAVTRKRKDAEITTWFNVTCWRKDAEFVQKYIKKGQLIYVEGEVYEEEWEGKKSIKVEARKVLNMSPRVGEQQAPPSVPDPVSSSVRAVTAADEIPF